MADEYVPSAFRKWWTRLWNEFGGGGGGGSVDGPTPPTTAGNVAVFADTGGEVLEEATPAAVVAAGGAIHVLGSEIVATNSPAKVPIFTVPVGKTCIVTMVVARDPSADLTVMSDSVAFGFDAGASEYYVSSIPLFGLADPPPFVITPSSTNDIIAGSNQNGWKGNAGEVFGVFFNDPSIDATMVVDVIGYLY